MNAFPVTNDDEKSAWNKIQSVGPWIREKAKSSFRKKVLYKRLPILDWLPK